jgi:hypothetical protein
MRLFSSKLAPKSDPSGHAGSMSLFQSGGQWRPPLSVRLLIRFLTAADGAGSLPDSCAGDPIASLRIAR